MFEVTTTITREGCRAQATARLSHHVREICVVLAVIALATLILFVIRSTKTVYAAIGFAVVAVYAFLVIPMHSMRLYASRNAAVNSILIAFEENVMRVSTSVEETAIEYSRITGMEQNSEFIILYMKHHTPLVFKKTEVLHRRADQLCQFLENKTGKELRSFKG